MSSAQESSSDIKNVKIDASTFLLQENADQLLETTEEELTNDKVELENETAVQEPTEDFVEEEEEEEQEEEQEELSNETREEKTIDKITDNLNRLTSRDDFESMSGGADDDEDDEDEEDDDDVIDMTDEKLYQVLSGVLVDDDGNNVCDNILKIANGIDKHNDLLSQLVSGVKESNKKKDETATTLRTLADTMKAQNSLIEKIVSSFNTFVSDQDEEENVSVKEEESTNVEDMLEPRPRVSERQKRREPYQERKEMAH
jgi:hypothetical protein